jgi:Tol biopolymer transport system component
LTVAFAVLAPLGSSAATNGSSRIAFTLDRDGFTSLYSVRPNGKGLRRLTAPHVLSATGGDSGPAWAPSGKRLVFARDLPHFGVDHVELYVVRSDGNFARRLSTNPYYDLEPAWSPDGKRIAYVRVTSFNGTLEAGIAQLGSDGSSAADLTRGPLDVTPSYGPDGSQLVFARLPGPGAPLEQARLFVVGADGQNARPLGVSGWAPAWSPDGKRIAFVSFRDRNGQSCESGDCLPNGELYIVASDGTGLTRLTRSTADDEHPTWSPDGTRIAYASGYDTPRLGHPPWLYVRPAGGGPATLLRRGTVADPAWSPAGVR